MPAKLAWGVWFRTGRVEGGRRAAGIYSLMQTCKLHGVDPQEDLTDVLRRVMNTSIGEVAELTPRRWREARKKAHATS